VKNGKREREDAAAELSTVADDEPTIELVNGQNGQDIRGECTPCDPNSQCIPRCSPSCSPCYPFTKCNPEIVPGC